jgi:hypothetical protein
LNTFVCPAPARAVRDLPSLSFFALDFAAMH